MNLMRLEAQSNAFMYYFSSISRRRLRSICAVWTTVFLLAGCGDVRGQADEGRLLRLSAAGSRYLALQDGLGAWQVLELGENVLTVSLTDPQGLYGVMGVCLDEASGALSVTVNHGVAPVTVGDAAPPLVDLACSLERDTSGAATKVQGHVRGLEAGEYGSVYLGASSSLVDAASPAHHLELRDAAANQLELIASKYSGEARLPSVMLVTQPLELVPNGLNTIDIDFASPSAFVPELAQVPLSGVRPGELLSGSVELVSRLGTRALLGEVIGEGALSYARPPERVLRRASLWAEAQSFTYDRRTKAGLSRSAGHVFAGGVVAPLALPPSLNLRALTLRSDPKALRPRATWRATFGQEGIYTQFYSQIHEGRSLSYRLNQSATYLNLLWPGGEAASYLLPDFSVLPEWQESWNLQRGSELFWDVSFSFEDASQTVFSSRSGVLGAAQSP